MKAVKVVVVAVVAATPLPSPKALVAQAKLLPLLAPVLPLPCASSFPLSGMNTTCHEATPTSLV